MNSIRDILPTHMAAEYTSAMEEIIQAGNMLWERGMVASNDGNISARLSNNTILATPTGISKYHMKEDDFVLLDLQGTQIAGRNKPSSEIKMHVRAYSLDSTLRGVVHAHPPYATLHAVKGISPLSELVAETVVLLPCIPIAKFAVPSTAGVADSINDIIPQSSVCLLEHHGALAWGASVMSAYFDLERLEHISKLSFLAKISHMDRALSAQQLEEIYRVFPHVRP